MVLTQLERDCIDGFRAGTKLHEGKGSVGDVEAWSGFMLRMLLEAARALRRARIRQGGSSRLKIDGSPTVEIEHGVEAELRGLVARIAPDATFIGEESGGALPSSGLAVAVDPVDGTWAFINGMETFATSITVFRDGEAFAGAVCNPSTGEVGYTTANGNARLVQLSTFGEGDDAVTLPTAPLRTQLVNVHPSRAAGPLLQRLYEAWQDGSLRMVRSPGGSPAWAMLEAAKGNFVYVNLWSGRDAEPYDLAGSTLLIRAAGGDVIDVSGQSIDPLAHRGPFIAAANREAADSVRRYVLSVTT